MGIEWLLDSMAQRKQRPAIVWRDHYYSYGQLLDTFFLCRNRLQTEAVHWGEIVALEGDYSPTACALLLALIANRNVIVPITTATGVHRENFLDIAEVQVVITVNEKDEFLIARSRRTVGNPLIVQLQNMQEPGLVLFSSGSTGKHKAALHVFTLLLDKFKVPRQSMRTITFLLFDHIGGINTLFYTLSNGGTVISLRSRDPEVVCEAIERHAVELLPTSPTFLNLLLISEAYRHHGLSSLKVITYGTEVMPEATLQRLHRTFPTVKLQQTYGLSEVGILRSKSRQSDSLWVKVGGDGYETKIVDNVLWVRAKCAMLGYLNAPSPFDDEGWMNSEDLVEVDSDYIRILGRRSDIINVGGQKVYPGEVENILLQMENVRDATVRGEANPLTGNIVVATVVLDAPEEVSALKRRMRTFCRTKLESYKIPVKVETATQIKHTERFKKVRS